MSNIQRIDPAGEAGRAAVRHGRSAKSEVEAILHAGGHAPKRGEVVGTTIFGADLRVHFLVEPCPAWPRGLIVHVISQESRGSADHKFPFIVQNIKQRYPYPTVVVLLGSGFSCGALSWLRSQADGHELLAVTVLEEFKDLVRRQRAG